MNEHKSPKEQIVENKLQNTVEEIVTRHCDGDRTPIELLDILLTNKEIKAIHDYANSVSITRIGLNDHGPVHMKTVCHNALKMLLLLHEAGVETSLEKEHSGTFTDSVCAVMIAALLHDCGMTIGRTDHELYSGIISFSLITDILRLVLPKDEDIVRRTVIRSVAMEGIIGHMCTHPIHSIEAGLILIADGSDMTKGRARIPIENQGKPAEGDIHKFSANAINKVRITTGKDRPIKLEVHMTEVVGLFQVEAVLIPKLKSSPAMPFVALEAFIEGKDTRTYLWGVL